MMGVLAPNEGAVHIDDLDLQEFAASSIRRQASYLPAANTAFRVLEGLHRPSLPSADMPMPVSITLR